MILFLTYISRLEHLILDVWQEDAVVDETAGQQYHNAIGMSGQTKECHDLRVVMVHAVGHQCKRSNIVKLFAFVFFSEKLKYRYNNNKHKKERTNRTILRFVVNQTVDLTVGLEYVDRIGCVLVVVKHRAHFEFHQLKVGYCCCHCFCLNAVQLSIKNYKI